MAIGNEPTPQEVVLDDLNYEAWAPIMKATLVERGLWDVVENVAPPNLLSMPEIAATIQAKDLSPWRDFVVKDTKAIHILQCSVPDSVFRQTLNAASAKDLWNLLQESNVQAKLQKDFEQLQIDFRERFSSYIDRVTFINGSTVEAQGIGDVRIVTREGKMKTIKDVLYVPGIVASVLSVKGLWDVVENGVPPDPSKNPKLSATIQPEELSKWRDLVVKDTKALQVLQSSLPNSAFRKTLSASCAKDAWDLLKNGNKAVELYLMLAEEALGNGTYDEDVWMIYPDGTTNHMTPYEKYFTALDRTHKAKIGLADGKFLRVEGRGDVKIMMKDGKKKMIKNVLFVPGLNRNVLSLNQMIERGYSAFTPPGKCTFLDRTGAVFGETVRDKRGPALRFQVIEGSLTS
ncbi:unnamed protein product [Brassica rapa]|uniref:Retrovirus-related Pol polyprotein from transposon TNT 1-94-like beta-barrel domain-containing protein n=1 Tax=Brassica campestris TaxID=3711 RepID=A0A8D9GDW7_BRACM|nr:unnamed protein product [Brassica rapa]